MVLVSGCVWLTNLVKTALCGSINPSSSRGTSIFHFMFTVKDVFREGL
jgi:hypothetical protein